MSTVTLDALGRVVSEQVTGLEAVNYHYDTLGRLDTITQRGRESGSESLFGTVNTIGLRSDDPRASSVVRATGTSGTARQK